MTINIAENIRRLRRKRDLTQDELAATLGVMPQTISKWETGTGYPDLEIIPSIANFFAVTTDELLGVDVSRAKEKIQAFINELDALMQVWKLDELIARGREMCREFPGTAELRYKLAAALHHKGKWEDAIELAAKIAEETNDLNLKLRATCLIVYANFHGGNKSAAREAAKNLPDVENTRQAARWLSDGQAEIDFARDSINRLFDVLADSIQDLADMEGYNPENDLPPEEKILLHKQLLQLQSIIYGEELYFRNYAAYTNNEQIARLLTQLERYDEAISHLEKAVDHALKFDSYGADAVYSSPLMNGVKAEKQSNWSGTAIGGLLFNLKNNEAYAPLRTNPRFLTLTTRAEAATDKQD
ncbi:MAG: helix-turn-helix domain-containing protein [Oscillospiraceae bacterium]|jgi:transcriptional regulator with XRE-family HTH domain|nr:helix-turn-helix domain-containing protein [Oscillospiraceae bacterium]